MRLLALGLAAAALAIPVSSASAEDCAGVNHVEACVTYQCYTHYCIQQPASVYTDCRHPLPDCDRTISLKPIGTR